MHKRDKWLRYADKVSSAEEQEHIFLSRALRHKLFWSAPLCIPARDQCLCPQRLKHTHQLRRGLGLRQPVKHAFGLRAAPAARVPREQLQQHGGCAAHLHALVRALDEHAEQALAAPEVRRARVPPQRVQLAREALDARGSLCAQGDERGRLPQLELKDSVEVRQPLERAQLVVAERTTREVAVGGAETLED